MRRMKKRKSSWIDIKKVIKAFEPSDLVSLVKDLYQLSEENMRFLNARYADDGETYKRYKKIISKCLCPDVLGQSDDFDFKRAKKTISDFAKATGDDERTTDLMIYFVECGNQFTLDYGDINEVFYDTLIEMYEKAVDRVRKMQKNKQESFRKRLEKIMKSSDGIGWGYHDDLCYFYYEVFQ